jgi:threonine dehydrogenase-like Zn-dependent dehydrogenase
MTLHQDLPKTHRALVLTSTDKPPIVQTVPTPQPGPGSVILRILTANVISYMRDIYNGKRNYAYPIPLTIGTSAIGRVAAVGPDATSLKPGQLVLYDVTIRGRDDPSNVFLLGVHQGFSTGSAKLMEGEWRDATYAEYCKAPLENCHVLHEERLCGKVENGGLGYSIEDLAVISRLLVPYGGLRDIGLKAGETIIVAPATGPFGGAAVSDALAMGARVIAMGRNVDALKRLSGLSERVKTVQITGDEKGQTEELKKYGPVNAFFDISPPEAANTTHIKSAIMALKSGGRVSLMGGIRGDIAIPYFTVVHKDLLLKGRWTYPREAVGELIKMVEVGVLRIGDGVGFRTIGKFGLEQWDAAFTASEKNAASGAQSLIVP